MCSYNNSYFANSVEGWGNGCDQQFDTMSKFIDEDAFVNESLIGK